MLIFHFDLSVDAGLLGALLLYLWMGRRWSGFEPSRVAWFLAGLALVWAALESPLDTLGDEYLQSAHMVQHMLLMAVAPPMLLTGLSDPIAMRISNVPAARYLTGPLQAQAAAAAAIVIWHLPGPYDAALANDTLHIVEHLSFLGAGILYWWPILETTSAHARWRLTEPQKLIYILAGVFPMMGVSLALQFSHLLFYPYYAHVPRILPAISPLTDQIIAGTVMMLMDMTSNGVAGLVIVHRWLGDSVDEDLDRQTHLLERR